MSISLSLRQIGGAVLLNVLFATAVQATLVSAILPSSRSVQVGTTATIFATVINAGSEIAENCQIGLESALDAVLFFQTTDPATNALTGVRDQPVSIAAGMAQTFLVGITPNAEFSPTDVVLSYTCTGVAPAASVSGLNTLLLSANTTPVPDIVAIALTPSGDGVAQLPKESGLGFLSMASVNVGSGADLTVTARTPAGFDGALLICETNPVDGSCLQTAAASVSLNVAAFATPTFAVFLSSFLALPLDPANRRLFVEFKDDTGAVRGSTSVAIAGGGPDIEPQFPTDAAGLPVLPAGQAADQLAWIIEQLAASSTSIADIAAHFTTAASASSWQSFIASLRNGDFGNAKVIDIVSITPVSLAVVIARDAPGAQQGFLTLGTEFVGDGLINSFGVSNYGGTVQFVQDQNLTLEQAADDFIATGSQNSLLVARINSANQCVVQLDRQADVPRTIASVFKIWVLGGVARALESGAIQSSDTLALDPAKFALGGTINSEPAGTQFTLQQMATLMLGISDNTATDHLHALVGQSLLDETVEVFNHATPILMQPLLSISQQFSLYFSFPFADSSDYVNGTEAQQRTFHTDRMVPLGSVLGGAFFHNSLLVDAAWMASPLDVCNAFVSLRAFDRASAAFEIIDEALSAGVAQPGVRSVWDRAWYKGGNLVGNNEQRVLTHAWFLESAEFGRYVVVAMANNRVSGDIDTFEVQSLTGRILQLVAESAMP